MTNVTTTTDSLESATATAIALFDNWIDPIETGVRDRVREFIEELIRCELDAALARPRYARAKHADSRPANVVGHRHGSRTRSLVGSFGKTEITVPRARLQTSDGKTTECQAQFFRLKSRRGPKKAAIAVAASLLTAAYHMLKDGTFHQDLGAEFLVKRDKARIAARLAKRIKDLGYDVTFAAAA